MPPTGAQLTRWLGQQAGLTSESNDLPKVASYYEVTSGRAPLRETLSNGLRDWNFRVMLETLKPARALKSAGSGSDRMSWAIQWEVTEVEEELWRRRQVGLYQMDVSTFVAGVEAKRP